MSRPHSLVIFDLDGTVVDTMDATFRSFQDALGPALGYVPDRAEILARMGPADQEIIADWVGPEHAAEAVARLYASYERRFRGLGPFPGMVELIRRLREAGRRTALFTGRGRPSTDRILQTMGLAGLFEVTVTGEEVPESKPAPHGILRILEVTGSRPEDAVYIGDSPLDVRAGRGAGIAVVTVLWGTHPPREFEEFTDLAVVRSPEELERYLGAGE